MTILDWFTTVDGWGFAVMQWMLSLLWQSSLLFVATSCKADLSGAFLWDLCMFATTSPILVTTVIEHSCEILQTILGSNNCLKHRTYLLSRIAFCGAPAYLSEKLVAEGSGNLWQSSMPSVAPTVTSFAPTPPQYWPVHHVE